MAGYIFTLDKLESLNKCVEDGVYSTVLSEPKNKIWGIHHEATFADYTTMSEGDNVYFFIDRIIYGIGTLVNIDKDCKYQNYPDASIPTIQNYSQISAELLHNNGPDSLKQRWVCFFKPEPYFFRTGVDMDDALESNPMAFKNFRAFWKRSFLKLDDDENQALKDVILKQNITALTPPNGRLTFNQNIASVHNAIEQKIKANKNNHELTINPLLEYACDGTKIKHEMAIEADLLYQLSIKDKSTIEVFGEWDFLSHQVIASPFKPIDYMDRMDCFGYSYINGYKPTKNRYLIVELKKDEATAQDIDQMMKYVDWVKDEYAHNDYGMIEAFLVAYDFSTEVKRCAYEFARRRYIFGRRPAKQLEWKNLKLVTYRYNPTSKKIEFKLEPTISV